MHVDWPGDKLEAAIQDRGGTLWVDIENPDGNSTEQAESLLRDVFGFHPLAIEDALQESHVPKVDDWGDYLYLVFHGTSIDPQTDELRLHELDIFLGPNYLVTYHTEPLSFLEQDRQAIERDPRDRMQHGCDHLLFQFLERAVDQSLEAIEHLDDRIDDIQDEVFENPPRRDAPDDLPDQAVGDPPAQDLRPPARGPEPPGPRPLQADPGRAPGLLPRRLRPRRADPRHLREPPRPDRRHARDVSLGRCRTGPTTS